MQDLECGIEAEKHTRAAHSQIPRDSAYCSSGLYIVPIVSVAEDLQETGILHARMHACKVISADLSRFLAGLQTVDGI